MDQFIIIAVEKRLYLYEIIGEQKVELFRIRGESYYSLTSDKSVEKVEELKKYLLEALNYQDFSSCSFMMIYNNLPEKLVTTLSAAFSSAQTFQPEELTDILPELLLKAGKITLGNSKLVSFNQQYWLVETDKFNVSEIESPDRVDIELEVADLPEVVITQKQSETAVNEQEVTAGEESLLYNYYNQQTQNYQD